MVFRQCPSDDTGRCPAIAVQRIAGDDLGLEIEKAENLKRGANVIAIVGLDRGKPQAQFAGIITKLMTARIYWRPDKQCIAMHWLLC